MMYKLLLAAGAASLAFATPALADPSKNKGQGNKAKHDQTVSKSHSKSSHAKHSRHHNKVYQGHADANWWGNRNCPPGLAKKHNRCLPPGIAKKRYDVGDRWSGNYRQWSYNQVPTDWRNRYGLDRDNRYYYRDGYLYSVDPRTRLVDSVIRTLIN